jgi:hypothetical protein
MLATPLGAVLALTRREFVAWLKAAESIRPRVNPGFAADG